MSWFSAALNMDGDDNGGGSGLGALAPIAGAGLGAYFGGPAGAAIGGSIGSSFMQFGAQNAANKANIKEAEKNRQFQERMSSTAYQRAMYDMEQAGLNPMLAFSQGGASTPGGAQGSVDPATLDLNPAIQQAIAVKTAKQNLENMSATEKQIRAQTQKTNVEAKAISKQMPKNEAIGETGRMLKQGLETINSSAKKSSKLMDKGFDNIKNRYDKYKMSNAEKQQLKKYKKSQAYRDAQKRRKK